MAAAIALALFGAVPGRAASECGRYEDGERASHRAIGWRDFKALGRSEAVGRAVAYIATSIVVEPLTFEAVEEADGSWSARPGEVCVRAFMLKRASGFLHGEVRRADLAHEQGHFDLTEIFARALRQRLASIRESGASREAVVEATYARSDRTLREVLEEWRAAQRLYDLETECDARAQLRWLHWIHLQLALQPEFIHLRPLVSPAMGGRP